jgi:hypothetical protein
MGDMVLKRRQARGQLIVWTANESDITEIRQAAIQAGGVDPVTLRFRVIEYDKDNGEFRKLLMTDSSLSGAVMEVRRITPECPWSRFVLEPIAFINDFGYGVLGKDLHIPRRR